MPNNATRSTGMCTIGGSHHQHLRSVGGQYSPTASLIGPNPLSHFSNEQLYRLERILGRIPTPSQQQMASLAADAAATVASRAGRGAAGDTSTLQCILLDNKINESNDSTSESNNEEQKAICTRPATPLHKSHDHGVDGTNDCGQDTASRSPTSSSEYSTASYTRTPPLSPPLTPVNSLSSHSTSNRPLSKEPHSNQSRFHTAATTTTTTTTTAAIASTTANSRCGACCRRHSRQNHAALTLLTLAVHNVRRRHRPHRVKLSNGLRCSGAMRAGVAPPGSRLQSPMACGHSNSSPNEGEECPRRARQRLMLADLLVKFVTVERTNGNDALGVESFLRGVVVESVMCAVGLGTGDMGSRENDTQVEGGRDCGDMDIVEEKENAEEEAQRIRLRMEAMTEEFEREKQELMAERDQVQEELRRALEEVKLVKQKASENAKWGKVVWNRLVELQGAVVDWRNELEDRCGDTDEESKGKEVV